MWVRLPDGAVVHGSDALAFLPAGSTLSDLNLEFPSKPSSPPVHVAEVLNPLGPVAGLNIVCKNDRLVYVNGVDVRRLSPGDVQAELARGDDGIPRYCVFRNPELDDVHDPAPSWLVPAVNWISSPMKGALYEMLPGACGCKGSMTRRTWVFNYSARQLQVFPNEDSSLRVSAKPALTVSFSDMLHVRWPGWQLAPRTFIIATKAKHYELTAASHSDARLWVARLAAITKCCGDRDAIVGRAPPTPVVASAAEPMSTVAASGENTAAAAATAEPSFKVTSSGTKGGVPLSPRAGSPGGKRADRSKQASPQQQQQQRQQPAGLQLDTEGVAPSGDRAALSNTSSKGRPPSATYSATTGRSLSPRPNKAAPSSSTALMSPDSEAGRSMASTYSTDKGMVSTIVAANAAAVARRGKYVGKLPMTDLKAGDGNTYRQLDVQLKPIQIRRTEASGAVTVSLGLGISLVTSPLGVCVATVTPVDPQDVPRIAVMDGVRSMSVGRMSADRGVRQGDVILAVNCESVEGKGVREVAQLLLCGPVSYGVNLRLARAVAKPTSAESGAVPAAADTAPDSNAGSSDSSKAPSPLFPSMAGEERVIPLAQLAFGRSSPAPPKPDTTAAGASNPTLASAAPRVPAFSYTAEAIAAKRKTPSPTFAAEDVLLPEGAGAGTEADAPVVASRTPTPPLPELEQPAAAAPHDVAPLPVEAVGGVDVAGEDKRAVSASRIPIARQRNSVPAPFPSGLASTMRTPVTGIVKPLGAQPITSAAPQPRAPPAAANTHRSFNTVASHMIARQSKLLSSSETAPGPGEASRSKPATTGRSSGPGSRPRGTIAAGSSVSAPSTSKPAVSTHATAKHGSAITVKKPIAKQPVGSAKVPSAGATVSAPVGVVAPLAPVPKPTTPTNIPKPRTPSGTPRSANPPAAPHKPAGATTKPGGSLTSKTSFSSVKSASSRGSVGVATTAATHAAPHPVLAGTVVEEGPIGVGAGADPTGSTEGWSILDVLALRGIPVKESENKVIQRSPGSSTLPQPSSAFAAPASSVTVSGGSSGDMLDRTLAVQASSPTGLGQNSGNLVGGLGGTTSPSGNSTGSGGVLGRLKTVLSKARSPTGASVGSNPSPSPASTGIAMRDPASPEAV